jgi:hypothetical protein
MAILNVDCQLNVVLLICDVLSEVGPTPKDQLVKLCMSGVEKDPNNRTIGSINQLNDKGEGAGLFHEDTSNNQTISFSDNYKEIINWSQLDRLKNLPKFLRRIIFANNLKDDFMTSNEGTNDINRAFAWLLAQNVYTMSLDNRPMFELERNQLQKKKERVLDDNSSRTPNMREWGAFLGFIDQSSSDKGMVDPTGAIKDVLSDIFGKKNELKAKNFINYLNEALPVLDGGKFRIAVENCLNSNVWSKPEDGVLSTSLSRSLWRLHNNPTVPFFLDDRSDAGALGLDLPQDGSPKNFSDVRRS